MSLLCDSKTMLSTIFMKIALISAFARGLWLIDGGVAESYRPYVNKLINGERIDFPKYKSSVSFDANKEELCYTPKAAVLSASQVDPMLSNLSKAPKNSVAIIPLQGIVMQDDFCGSPGLNTLRAWMQEADNNPNIIGQVLYTDSPGGNAQGVDGFSKFIKDLNKPVVGFVDGRAASAAYWIISACKEVVASEPITELGSIGAYSTFIDYSKNDEMNGIREIVVKAPQSQKKNQLYDDIKAGKTDEYANRFLAPLVDQFHKTVKQNRRGNVSKMNADVFAGDLFNGTEAVELGLADRIGSFKSAIQSVIDLSKPKAA